MIPYLAMVNNLTHEVQSLDRNKNQNCDKKSKEKEKMKMGDAFDGTFDVTV